jgi:hypothetical protein
MLEKMTMKSFSKLYSDFWINYDNSAVLGTGVDGQLMAVYLQSNTHQNMLGAYYLPLLYISSDLKLSVKKVHAALKKLCKMNYCKYDDKTQHVWVCNLVSEQVGEEVDIKDNRIKALQAIWTSLPSKLEFLEEIYNKYHNAFHLEKRGFENFPKVCEKENSAAPLTIDTNVIIQPVVECLPPVVPLFEGASKLLESQPEDKSADVLKENSFEAPLKVPQIPFEAASEIPDTTILVKDLSDETKNVQDATTVIPSIEPQSISEDYSKFLPASFEGALHPLSSPFEGASDPLQSPFEGPSDPLRSNIEDISKKIEEINKKKEIEEESEKEKRKKININNTQVLNSNIVAQARRCVGEQSDKISFFEKPKETGKLDLAKAKEPEKEPCIQSPSNFPIILASSNPKLKSKLEVADSKNTASDSLAAVFDHWKSTMQHSKSNLDYKRKVLIRKALQLGYSVERLCNAITGCSLSPFHTGSNPQGQHYTGLHIILRDADQIDKFIHNYHHPPKPRTEADERLHANSHVVKEWIEKKRNESNKSADAMRNNHE